MPRQIRRAAVQLMDNNNSFFSESDLIFSFTTKDAVADGLLIRVTDKQSKEVGIKYPVYMTETVWKRYVEVPEEMKSMQDLSGRLWDVLYMFALQAKKFSGSTLFFDFVCQMPCQKQYLENEKKADDNCLVRGVRLKSTIQAQDVDDPSPAIFIMMPDED